MIIQGKTFEVLSFYILEYELDMIKVCMSCQPVSSTTDQLYTTSK